MEEVFLQLTAAEPTDEERRTCLEALKELGPSAQARAALVHTLLNHQDFITIR